MPDRLSSIRASLEAHDQSHLLRFYDELDDARRRALLDQIDEFDLSEIGSLIRDRDAEPTRAGLPPDIAPCPFYPCDPTASWRGETTPPGELAIDYDADEMRG